MRVVATVVLSVCALVAGPGGATPGVTDPLGGAVVDRLVVYATSDAAATLSLATREFQRRSGTRVSLVLGNSGMQAFQIMQGAPADVVIADDQAVIDRLIIAGSVTRGSDRRLASSPLVPVCRAGRGADPEQPERLVVLSSASAAGRATEQLTFRDARWREAVRGAIRADDAGLALQVLRSGAAELALVPRAALPAYGVTEIPGPTPRTSIVPVAAITRRTARLKAARAFLDFVAEGGQ